MCRKGKPGQAAHRRASESGHHRKLKLAPVAIEAADGPVVVSLHAAWEPGHHAAATLRALAGRLQSFLRARYGATPAP